VSESVRTQGRIPNGGFRELGLINWVYSRILARVAQAPQVHLITVLGQHRRLFRVWYLFGAVLWAGRLPKKEAEVVILRIAHLRNCAYELQLHRRLAERRGVAPEVQAKIFAWPAAGAFTPRWDALLAATDDFVQKRTVTAAVWAELARYLDHRQLIEFCMLAAQYDGLATTMSALEMPLDYPAEEAS
jgi:4-carboxymuconolactone decarboxylase